mgnify:CR=1 FL=1
MSKLEKEQLLIREVLTIEDDVHWEPNHDRAPRQCNHGGSPGWPLRIVWNWVSVGAGKLVVETGAAKVVWATMAEFGEKLGRKSGVKTQRY